MSERLGCTVSFSECGGIEIEENWDKVKTVLLPSEKPMTSDACAPLIATLPLEVRAKIGDFIEAVYAVFQETLSSVSNLLSEPIMEASNSKSAGADVNGIELGAIRKCVSIMEGKISFLDVFGDRVPKNVPLCWSCSTVWDLMEPDKWHWHQWHASISIGYIGIVDCSFCSRRMHCITNRNIQNMFFLHNYATSAEDEKLWK